MTKEQEFRKVLLVRHGESAANAGLATEVPATIGLTEVGRQQANELAARFTHEPSRIVVSPYLRTQQTAQPLLARYPSVPLDNWSAKEFTFLSPERYRGTTAQDRRGAVKAYWNTGDADYVDGPGAESFNDFIGRVRSFIARIQAVQESGLVVFSHGYVINAVIWLTLHAGDTSGPGTMQAFYTQHQTLPLANCAVFPVQVTTTGALFLGSPLASTRQIMV